MTETNKEAGRENPLRWFTPEFDVTTANRKTLVDYLENHRRYYTMNPWNGSTSYANNVKLPNLELSKRFGEDIEERCWELVTDESIDIFELALMQDDIINRFRDDTGYEMGLNGRSCGYLVMYDTVTEYSRDGEPIILSLPGMSIDQNTDFDDKDEWDMDALRERAITVARFDQACDEIIAALVHAATCGEIQTHTEVIEKTRRTLVINDGQED